MYNNYIYNSGSQGSFSTSSAVRIIIVITNHKPHSTLQVLLEFP